MLALLTSCARFDLLEYTLTSLYKNQQHTLDLTITEDGLIKKGQHAQIQRYLQSVDGKYYLHLEDDWEFENNYNWIEESIKIMEYDPTIIKVLCRRNSPHPCEHDIKIDGLQRFGYIQPWENNGVVWSGFSWNPGVTRLDLLKQFLPFSEREQNVAEDIYKAGYKVVELHKPIYTHIGNGRSTTT
jgi:hypothetical protein